MILDSLNLSITFLVSLGWQALGFTIAYTLQVDTITDFWSAINAAGIAVLTLAAAPERPARSIVATCLVAAWAARLGAFQLFRMIKLGGDTRFDEMRADPVKFSGFWIFQLVWVWTIVLPVTVLNSPELLLPFGGGSELFTPFGNARDVAGLVMWGVGFAVEAAADMQKYLFKAGKPPRGAITDCGVWRFSRRPNYFGEMLLWWGTWVLALGGLGAGSGALLATARARGALWGGVASPLLTMTLLLFLSGIPLAEKPTQQKYHEMSKREEKLEPFGAAQTETDPWARMRAFRQRTSLLIPMPPALYTRVPLWMKRTLFFDWPMFEFDPARDENNKKKEADAANATDAKSGSNKKRGPQKAAAASAVHPE